MNDDTGTCGMCGIDPVEFESVEIGLTIMNLCNDCYEEYIHNYKQALQETPK